MPHWACAVLTAFGASNDWLLSWRFILMVS